MNLNELIVSLKKKNKVKNIKHVVYKVSIPIFLHFGFLAFLNLISR